MPSVEVGNQTQISYLQETLFGVAPTGVGQILPWSDLSFQADRDFIENPVLRTDNMKSAGRGSFLKGKGKLTGPLAYGVYDDFIAAALGNWAWTANVAKVAAPVLDSAASISVDGTAKTFTRTAGSFIADGFAVGQYVDTNGDPTNAGNNGTFLISALTATLMTCSAATGLVTAAGLTAFNISQNIRPSYAIEKLHKVNGFCFPFLGCIIDGFEISWDSSSKPVQIAFDILSKTASNEQLASIFTGYAQPNSNNVMAPFEAVTKKGTAILPVTKGSLKVARNSATALVCGQNSIYDIRHGAATVTGAFDLLFDSTSYGLYTDMRAENDIALQILLGPGSNKTYQADLTKCRAKGWKGDPKDGMFTASVDIESVAPTTGANTSCMITRIP